MIHNLEDKRHNEYTAYVEEFLRNIEEDKRYYIALTGLRKTIYDEAIKQGFNSDIALILCMEVQ